MNSTPSAIPVRRKSSLASVTLSNGSIEILKWIAIFCMVFDHANKALFSDKIQFFIIIGRLALPIFTVVLAYNLSRPGTLKKGAFPRTIKRLVIYGVISTPFYLLTFNGIFGLWPLNVMFMLAILVGIIWIFELNNKYRLFSIVLFIIGGALVEYWWVGLLCGLSAWLFFKIPNKKTLSLWILSLFLLCAINGNFWTLIAVPVIFLFSNISFDISRNKNVFYIMYPLHLAILAFWKYTFLQ
jgi:hypothetical protein